MRRVLRQVKPAPRDRKGLRVALSAIVLFGLGLGTALFAVAPATAEVATTSTTATAASLATTTVAVATTTTGTGAATGENGSTWIFVFLVLGLGLFFAVPYVIDVVSTHRRWDKLLSAAQQDGLTVDELREFGTRTPMGIEGLARALMAFVVIGILGASLFYVLVKTPTTNSGAIISNLLSTLGTLATAIIAFYFGTRASGGGTTTDGSTADGGAAAPANTAPPTIDGTPMLGSTLTASPGVWTSLPSTYDYQWQREGDPDQWTTIASGQSYDVTPDDAGHRLRVTVTATNSAGTSEAAPSAPVDAP